MTPTDSSSETPSAATITQSGATREQLLLILLQNHDIPCPLCNYSLHNLTSNYCPECGGELTLQVGLVEGRMRPYITVLVACCVGFGGSALFGIVALAAAPREWWRNTAGITLVIQLLFTGLLLPIILSCRPRFRRLSSKTQRLLAMLMWAAVAALSLIFIVTFKDH